jgi:hypothetical protein
MREVDLGSLKSMKAEIDAIEQHAVTLASLGDGVPAIEKNVRIVLSAAYVLKCGVSDIVDIHDADAATTP